MNTQTLSVVVGRFQVPVLHNGHSYLLDTVSAKGDMLVVLGSHAGLADDRNPLPFEVRKRMILAEYPQAQVEEIFDRPSNLGWSLNLDDIVRRVARERTAMLYASRDSFASVYEGDLPVTIIPPLAGWSGSEARDRLAYEETKDFRAGLILAQRDRHPISYQAVDIGVIDHKEQRVLLGQKDKDQGAWRLVGGFVDPADTSLEHSATRELEEEAGRILTHELQYMGSYRIDDHRYRDSRDGVMTALFATYHLGGHPRPGDDLDRVAWIRLSDMLGVIVPQHKVLAERLMSFVQQGSQSKGEHHGKHYSEN